MKLKTWLLPAGALAMALSMTSARADTTWYFSYNNDASFLTATGSFTTAGAATSYEAVTSITGTYTVGSATYTITGLASLLGTDNLFSDAAADTYFDGDGLAFTISDSGSTDINLYYDDGFASYANVDGTSGETTPVDLTVTEGPTTGGGGGGSPSPVPEPSSLAMLLASLGLVGVIARKRSKR